MMYIPVAMLLLLLAVPIDDGLAKVLLLALAQGLLLAKFLFERTASALGTFVFMSFLFFGLRPIYLVVENDYVLLSELFGIGSDERMVDSAMWWATAGMLTFVVGGLAGREFIASRQRGRPEPRGNPPPPLLAPNFCQLLLTYQIVSLLYMIVKGGSMQYDSALGAYLYDLPVLLQGGQLFSVLALGERFIRTRGKRQRNLAIFSIGLFFAFTVLLRGSTLFRGQWITGIMILGLALGMRWRGRFSLVFIAGPILLLMPLFRVLGQERYAENKELVTRMKETAASLFTPRSYWDFLDSNGDINIFDTFVAAKESTPEYHPYLLSWLYVPVHFVPRKLWPSKPEGGVLQDMSFTNGAPYSPGIAGMFALDGGLFWMLGAMAVLGFSLASIEGWILGRLRGYLRLCCYAALVVNALFLTRFFLWQSFYQTLYFVVPCYFLHRYSRPYVIEPAFPPPWSHRKIPGAAKRRSTALGFVEGP